MDFRKVALTSLLCNVFVVAVVIAEGTKGFEDDRKIIDSLNVALEQENEKVETAIGKCATLRDDLRKKMFGASVKEKSKFRKHLRKNVNCSCKVRKLSIKKKITILEKKLKELKTRQKEIVCK